jgi:protoporphyrin/coproporphyrin ferrochelatase
MTRQATGVIPRRRGQGPAPGTVRQGELNVRSRRRGPVTPTEDCDTPAMIGKLSRIVTAGCRKAGVDPRLAQDTNRRIGRIGVLLAQLGTPDAPTPAAVRRYLRQFLSDPRVVEGNRVLWWFVLRLLILPRRPHRSAALYRRIWSPDGSPLLVISQLQARALEAALNRDEPERFKVVLGMRYGSPSIGSAVQELARWGADRLLLFPLYPQYAAATTGSTYDEVFRQLSLLRFVPALRVVPPYYAHPAYIDALAQSARDAMTPLSRPPDRIIISFHGLPRRFIERGDPYASHCEETARALADRAGWEKGTYTTSYQSRSGREPWLQPYTDETLVQLARTGARHAMVICPGFVADCLETVDEIGHVGLEQFRAAGGERLQLVGGLNDRPGWIAAMAGIAREQLEGWA